MGGIGSSEFLKLCPDFRLNLLRQGLRCGDEETAGVRRMLRLCKEVRGNPSHIAFCGENNGFSRSCGQVDCAVTAYKMLRSGHVAITRSKNLFHARHGLRSIGQRANRLSAADTGDFFNTEEMGGREEFRIGSRTNHHDTWYGSDLRRYDGHD